MIGLRPADGPGLGSARAALELRDVTAGYGDHTVLHGIDIRVEMGQVVALLGPNGSGKTTLLRTAAGLLTADAGAVLIDGQDVTGLATHRRARAGLCLIPEGRGVFKQLTVRENLLLALPAGDRASAIAPAIDAFPVLGKRLGQLAGTMSGGEQQMLALCRAFLTRPKLVILDEVSIGLAPRIVDDIFGALSTLPSRNVAVLLVEQYIHRALEIADHVYLLTRGRLTFSGSPAQLDEHEVIKGYLGADLSADVKPSRG